MSTAVVLAEPEAATRGYLARQLTHDGFDVVAADDPCEPGIAADLVLLGDPAALDRWQPPCPVIVLGDAADDAVDRIRAFQRGCDDYVARPFDYQELLARMRAVLRRAAPASPEPPEHLVVGELVIDRPTRRVTIGEAAVALAAREYELLLALAADPQRVFTKEQLLKDVWGFRSVGRTRTLDSHASRLRRKLAAAGGRGFVVNVWGVGYKLVETL